MASPDESTTPVGNPESAPAAPNEASTPHANLEAARTNTAPSATSAGHSSQEEDWTEQISVQFEETIGKPSREAIHSFFYPQRGDEMGGSQRGALPPPAEMPPPQTPGAQTSPQRRSDMSPATFDEHFRGQAEKDQQFVHRFWTTYDDILILSLFTQVGIIFRLASSTWFAAFDDVFSKDSALFVNLPLNCMSCFIMGLFCSGERLMEIISTRFSPPRLQQRILSEDLDKSSRQRRKRARRNLAQAYSDDGEDENDSDSDGVMHPSPSGLLSSRHSGSFIDRHLYSSEEEDEEDYDEDPQQMEISDSLSGGGTGILRRRRRRSGRRRRRRQQSQQYYHHWEPPVQLDQDLRDVQLLALERRIRASKCLLLFPVRKEDVDVMEHYFQAGYKRDRDHDDFNGISEGNASSHHATRNSTRIAVPEGQDGGFTFDLELQEIISKPPTDTSSPTAPRKCPPSSAASSDSLSGNIPPPPVPENRVEQSASSSLEDSHKMTTVDLESRRTSSDSGGRQPSAVTAPTNSTSNASPQTPVTDEQETVGVDQIITDVTANVSENISRLRRVNIADGWDSGTTPEAMSDDLMLGLRDGFCGAVSSFSSWNSSMVNLMRHGNIGNAFVGYMLGLQLPIIAYRFGQHVAVYIFVWRCRYESKRDARRGYGIRVSMEEISERDASAAQNESEPGRRSEDEIPSVRAIITALFIMALVTQCTSLSFFSDPEHQQIALSLLFSPLGVLARWRLSKYNSWRPTFPLGTFTANILACALSGGFGSLLAGSPGPRERIVLVSFVAGFGGTMSSLATFIVEILAGIDPVLFRFDGMIYAVISLFWAMVVGFVFSASVDWADATD